MGAAGGVNSILLRSFEWYDSSTTPVGGVGSWLDKSANVFSATQGTGGFQPLCTANQLAGKNALIFDGVDDTLIVPAGANTIGSGNNTIFAVSRSTNDTTVQRIIRFPNSVSGAVGLAYSSNSGEMLYVSGATNLALSGVTKSNYNIFGAFRSGTALSFAVNNGTPVTNAGGANVVIDGIMTIGSVSNTQFLAGAIAELIIFNSALSLPERLMIWQYLSAKWGITIS